MRHLIIGTTLAIASNMAFSQILVHVSAQANEDSVGKRMIFALKEQIRRSAGMTLADDEGAGVISLGVVTIDPDKKLSSSGQRTVYSAVWSVGSFHKTSIPIYLKSTVGQCGSNRVKECAADLVADTDQEASEIGKYLK